MDSLKSSYPLVVQHRSRKLITLFIILAMGTLSLWAQTPKNGSVTGVVIDKETKAPVEGASIVLPQYDIWAVTNEKGEFSLRNAPLGDNKLVIQCLGMVSIENTYRLVTSEPLTIYMEQNSLRLQEVEVTAVERKAGATPITSISRAAMDHIQATSLGDVLSLLPGAVGANQTLAEMSGANIHAYKDSKLNSGAEVNSLNAMNSMGTTIIIDNAPVSNNANMQVPYAAQNGPQLTSSATSGFVSSAGNGIDLRQISADNIESVDVIKGIASVQYGDATSGAIIVNSKAGKSPLNIRFKINPNVTQTSASTGLKLGEKAGHLNVSFDYAHSLKDQRQGNNTYDRYSTKFLYSNTFLSKLRTNISLDVIQARDRQKQDADNVMNDERSHSKDNGFRFNANGSYLVNMGWLKTLQYTASTSYTKRDSYYQKMQTVAEGIVSTAKEDGSVVSNTPGQVIKDKDGNPITNWKENADIPYAIATQNAYLAPYTIDGREWNIFTSLKATFARELGISQHRLIVGSEYKGDGNRGDGKVYNPATPPNVAYAAAHRMRSFGEIPFNHQLAAYAEENMNLDIAGRTLNIQAGVRYDKQKGMKSEITPRVNASMEILKRKLWIRGGYGTIVKTAPLLYLHSENAYFDLLNYTNKTTEPNPALQQHIVTTRVFETKNKDLRMAKNKKYEIGFDLALAGRSLNVTAYSERMKNGYSFTGNNYQVVDYVKYAKDAGGELEEASRQNLFLKHAKPGNTLDVKTKGLDFDLNLGRIESIRTSFIINGGYMNITSYENAEKYYNSKNNGDPIHLKYVGIYEADNEKIKRQRFATNMRIVHNIPEIGFIISLSATTTWINKDQKLIENDSIPIAYISRDRPGERIDFDSGKWNDDEFADIVRAKSLNDKRFMTESAPVLWCFNVNLTKEIGKNFSASFFANNLFSYQPRYRNKRSDSYETYNPPIFFGVELSAKIPFF